MPRTERIALRLALVWLAAFALLAAQTLGLLHGVVHGQPATAAAVHAHPHGHAHGHNHPGTERRAPASLAQLFSGHDTGSACLVFDQLSRGDAPAIFCAPILPLVPAAFVARLLQGEVTARRTVLLEARGPPSH